MAESVTVTKTAGGVFQVVTTGHFNETTQFARGDFYPSQYGVIIIPYVTPQIMKKSYYPSEWTVGVATGFTTNLEVVEALNTLANS